MNHIRIVIDALPPKVRLGIYATFELVGYGLAATEAALLIAGLHWMPLTIVLTVYGFFSGRTHALARSNVPRPSGVNP